MRAILIAAILMSAGAWSWTHFRPINSPAAIPFSQY